MGLNFVNLNLLGCGWGGGDGGREWGWEVWG